MLSSKRWNNKASDIKLAYLYSTIKMMHGPINISGLKMRMSMERWWNTTDRGKSKCIGEKPILVWLYPWQISRGVAWRWTWASVVRGSCLSHDTFFETWDLPKWCIRIWFVPHREHSPPPLQRTVRVLSVDKKNQLDVTFCILYFSSNSCSTFFRATMCLSSGADDCMML